ncbi:PilZ domain-containing protein [Cyanobium gracile]|uniref:PilZ domain-containing protein n=1 Tax=Cyanobium gracile UHCC 0281 TaxID=3110309 RepID=A0ABU5SUZ1_9CYAN|nr:PilZ domain-containing protein [Cyanobium gracile]MEA5442344.1 PilZ domain-containing protein [Cyanobium gracile UHCC 0281]
MLTSACMSPEQTEGQPAEGEGQLEELRTALRHILPAGVSASLRLTSGRTIYVTVGDISRTGACVVRRGELEVIADEEVLLDVSDYERNQSVSLQARVKWIKTRSFNTLVGLVFTEGPVLPGTMLDQYLDRSLLARGGDG